MNRYRLPDLLIKLIYSTCFFHSVFAPPDSNSVAEVRLGPSNILKQLQSLDVNKAFLGLPSKLLQTCANEIFALNVIFTLHSSKCEGICSFGEGQQCPPNSPAFGYQLRPSFPL